VPAAVSRLTDASHIAVGSFFSCAMRAPGGVVCWGEGGDGELGNGREASSFTPTPVSGL
jgi:alpha-tubulin suppressor-like RCC1 family protein